MTEQQTDYSTKKKTIFRTIKNQDHPFVMIDRRPIENAELSWGAKGVLAYLLSRPDNWTVRLGDLVNRSPDGVYKIRGYVRELKKAGHIQAVEHRDEKTKRILEYVLEVYELPFSTKPLTNFLHAANLQAGNLTLNNKDLNDIHEEEEGGEKTNIFTLYTQEIGLLTPTIADAIEDWEKDVPEQWMKDAITEAVKNNARNWKYVEAILRRWKSQGSQEPAKKGNGANHANRKSNNQPGGKPVVEEFDPELAELGKQILAERRARQHASV